MALYFSGNFFGHTVDTRTVWPQTLSSVENEGPNGGLLGEDLDRGPPNAKGLIDGPPDNNDETPKPQGDIALSRATEIRFEATGTKTEN